MIVTGVVEEVITRNPTPSSTAFDVLVNGIKYGHGFLRPKVNKGDRVQFEVEQRGQFYQVKRGTLALYEGKDDPTPDVQQNAAQGRTSDQKGRTGATLPIPPQAAPAVRSYAANDEERQCRITFEATRKQAMDYVALLQQCDALWMKKVDKPKDRFDYVRTLVEDTHRRFYNEASNRADYLGNKPVTDETLTISSVIAEPKDEEWA